MRLTNATLLIFVWLVAITGLLATAASIANADRMDVTYDLPEQIAPSPLTVMYDPLDWENLTDGFTNWDSGQHNWGFAGIDDTVGGWVDPMTEEFDVTLDVVGGFIQPVDLDVLPTLAHDDWVRFFKIGGVEGIEWYRSQPDAIVTLDGQFSTPVFSVPEASAACIAAIGLALSALIVRRQ